MGAISFKFVFFAAMFAMSVAAEDSEDDKPFDATSIESGSYGSSSFGSSLPGSRFDTTPEEPSTPPPSALSQIQPLLGLIQPVLAGLLNGADPDLEPGVTYPPLLKPIFSPLPILPGFGVIPSSLAAQASDFLSAAAASARERFAKVAKENAARSQVNYGHILSAFNELNRPLDEEVESRKK